MALDISSGREKDKLFYTIVSHAVELLDADAGGIGLLNEQGQRIFVPFTYNLPDTLNNMSFNLNSDLFGLVINTGNAQRISDYQILAHPIKELADAGLSAVAVVPLRVRGKVIGVLWISMLSSGRPFSDYDVALLESIGGQAAVAIDNINLFEEQRHISEVLQRGFFPEKLPKLKQTDIGIFYASATEAAVVGGDFYDALEMPDGKVGLFVGDVSGKGIEAAADAAMVRYTIRTCSFHYPDPSSLLTQTNGVIASQLIKNHFVTLVYGSYDTISGQLLLGIAGHPYPLLFSAIDRKVTPIIGTDPAFALIPDYEYKKVGVKLSPGDILALYTDGIIELRRDKEFFGIERLGKLIEKYSHLKAQEIADRIINDAKEFANGHLTDDIVLMIIKRTD